jgi:hypothetical protein
VAARSSHRAWRDDVEACLDDFTQEICEYLWQHPSLYLGEAGGKHLYTFPPVDLGEVLYCGEQMFCTDEDKAGRVETMFWARRTNGQGEGKGGSAFMRFDLNDEFVDSLQGDVRVRVVYLDKGNGAWELQYDAKDDPNKRAYVVQKQNTNLWKEAYFRLTDAVFENRQKEGADLSLYNMADDEDIFHMIEVVRLEPPQPQDRNPEVGPGGAAEEASAAKDGASSDSQNADQEKSSGDD